MNNKSFLNGKFNIDLSWNIISFGLIAIIGLLINVVIVKFLNYEALGVFNQVLAFYLILSQLSSFGIHLSIQRYIPELQNKEEQKSSLMGALILLIGVSLLFLGLSFLFFTYIPLFSNEIRTSVIIAIPGVFLFSINKLLLSYLIGIRSMKAYSIFNALRYFLMLLFLGCLIMLSWDIVLLLVISELFLTFALLVYLYKEFKGLNKSDLSKWMKKHFHFGRKSFWGNLLLDANTKVDVIVLGLFVSTELVGVYSFAALFYEGFSQFLVVIRNNINPIITNAYFNSGKQIMNRVISKSIKKTYKFMTPLGLTGVLGYPVVLLVFGESAFFKESWVIFGILMLTNIGFSGLIPFNTIFNQIGQPLKQTLFFGVYFGINLILNLLLIPIIGVFGAAIALFTASALCNIYLVRFIFYSKSEGVGVEINVKK